MSRPVRYGLIGCGVFGRFCLEHFRRLPELELVAVADVDAGLAARTAGEFSMEACETPERLLERDDIDIVHLAVPPIRHGTLGMAAMQSGKHVLCEKPLAVSLPEASGMVRLSKARNVVLAVNLMMRYNQLCGAVKALIDSEVLGAPLHAHFVNDARDQFLPPEHWFWNPALSGGIFIEHGVHFFDLFEWWFGPGTVLAAQQSARPGTTLIEHVNCTMIYRNTILVNFYHGFHQAGCRDHQEWMIVFENGTLKMLEWVPTSLELDFIGTAADADRVGQIFNTADVRMLEEFPPERRHYPSRHRDREADGRFVLSMPDRIPKYEVYGHMLRGLMRDQISAIRTPGYRPLVNEQNGISSLVCAVEAQRLASCHQPSPP